MRSRSVRIGVLLVGTVVAVVAGLFALSPATAEPAGDPIEDPISGLTIREQRLSLWNRFHVDLRWSVPDSTEVGDTFLLTLPRQVAARTEGFDLTSPSGDVVARAEVTDGVVIFTMTDFVDTHRHVAGTAYFEAGFVAHATAPGKTNQLVFSTQSREFVVPVDVAAEVTDNTEPRKYGYWSDAADQGATEPRRALTWRAVSAVGPFETVEFDDRVGNGHTLDCDSLEVSLLTTFAANGDVTESEPLDPAAYTVDSCDTDGVHLTAGPVPAGDAVAVTYRSSVSDGARTTYDNEVAVVQDRQAVNLSSEVARAEAGGVGTGLLDRGEAISATDSRGEADPVALTGSTEPPDTDGGTAPANPRDESDAWLPDTGSGSLTLGALALAVLVAGIAQTLAARRRERS